MIFGLPILFHVIAAQTANALPPALVIEAKSFIRQERAELRAWKLIDDFGTSFLQALPDTRRTHDDRLIRGENFSDTPGELAVVTFAVKIPQPGRYFLWVRAYSTGTEDNGIHAGLDGMWPESGRRLQWCEGKGAWTWASKQRTATQHCGEQGKIWLDIPTAGSHEVHFSLREDGFRFDRFLLTLDSAYRPR